MDCASLTVSCTVLLQPDTSHARSRVIFLSARLGYCIDESDRQPQVWLKVRGMQTDLPEMVDLVQRPHLGEPATSRLLKGPTIRSHRGMTGQTSLVLTTNLFLACNPRFHAFSHSKSRPGVN